jgi:site-specific DNA recombinase
MTSKRAALYTRVSTPEQAEKGLSIPTQEKSLRKYAKDNGYVVVRHYSDEGESATTDSRTDFQKMVGDAQKTPKPFDAILTYRTDRFARNREDAVVYKYLLRKKCEIDVIFVTQPFDDSPIGQLLEGILECVDQFYSQNLSRVVKSCMVERAMQGRLNSRPPFGYTADEDGKCVIEPEEAKIVKWIYREYLKGRGFKSIAMELAAGPPVYRTCANGEKTPYKWNVPTVRAILVNRAYLGDLIWNIRKNKKILPKDEWIVAKNAHEPIIDEETFNEAQEIRKRRWKPRNPYGDYLLFGLAKCHECGGSLTRHRHARGKLGLRCGRHNRNGTCYLNYVWEDKLEKILLDYLQQLKIGRVTINPDSVLPPENAQQEVKEIESDIAKCDKKFERQFYAYQEGIIDQKLLKKAKREVEKEKRELKKRLDILTQRATISEAEVKRYVKRLIDTLEDKTIDVAEKRRAMRRYVHHIEWSNKTKRMYIYWNNFFSE